MRHTNLTTLESFRKVVQTSGTPTKLAPYYVSGNIAFNDNGASADTITDSGTRFLTEGFKAGDALVISGSSSNNKTVEISTVVAGTITLVSSAQLTTEAAGSSVTLLVLKGRKVEDGVGVVVKGLASNTGNITLAETSAKALNTNTDYDNHITLAQNQSVALQIKNLDQVWIDATVSGEGCEIIFEK